MQVNANQQIRPEIPVSPVGTHATSRKSDSTSEVEFSRSERLNRALENTPDVRAEEVVRAESLIQDVHYPPQETIRRISQLLALNWGAEEPKE